MAVQFTHLDAAESAFFSRELEQIRAKTYNVKYAALKGLQFVPADTSLDAAVENVTYRQWDQYGIAQFVTSYASDFPSAEVTAKEFTSKVKSVGASYRYNLQEIRASRREGKELDAKKAAAARRSIEQFVDNVVAFGDSSTGLLGMLNQPNALTYTVPSDGVGATATWSTKSSDQVARDMHGAARYIVEQTKECERPDTIILPLTSFGYISTTRMSTIDSTTILEYFLKTSPYITSVESWQLLETAGSGQTRRMVVYRRDPDALQFLMPVAFEQFPPQEQALEYIVYCHARVGGVVLYYPLSMAYADGV